MTESIGKNFNSPEVQQVYGFMDIHEVLEEDPHEGVVELRKVREKGIEVAFDHHDDRSLTVRAIRLFRRGDALSYGYQGALPFDIGFDDSPEEVLRKVKEQPIARKCDEFSGYYFWQLDRAYLHIQFSVLEARVDRVVLHGR